MPRGHRGAFGNRRRRFNGRFHFRIDRQVNVVDQQKVQRISNNMASKEKLLAYMTNNPELSIQLWNNPIIVDKLDANPALLDELNENPEVRVPQFIQENPPPPPPPSKCCTVV